MNDIGRMHEIDCIQDLEENVLDHFLIEFFIRGINCLFEVIWDVFKDQVDLVISLWVFYCHHV